MCVLKYQFVGTDHCVLSYLLQLPANTPIIYTMYLFCTATMTFNPFTVGIGAVLRLTYHHRYLHRHQHLYLYIPLTIFLSPSLPPSLTLSLSLSLLQLRNGLTQGRLRSFSPAPSAASPVQCVLVRRITHPSTLIFTVHL